MKNTQKLGPREFPFLGSGIRFGRDTLKFHDELHAEFGGIAQYSLLGSPYVAIFDPALVEHVLVKNDKNYVKTTFLRKQWEPFFGRGVLSADGEEWKRSRKVLQPMMSRDKLGGYFETVLTHSVQYAGSLEDGKVVNIKRDMMQLMLFSLVKILFHASLDDKKIERFGYLFNVCADYFDFTLSPAGILFHRFPSPLKKRFHAAIAELESLIQEVLSAHNDPSGPDLLSVLRQARDEGGKPFTAKQIRDNVLTLFIAGHETTSLGICYILFLLASHPAEMEKVQAEIDSVFQGRLPTFSELEKLKKTKNAINEAMRVYPPVGIIGRESLGEDQLGSVKVEKGTNIVIPLYSIHRSPRLFETPLEFKPDRWETPDSTSRRNEFIPFSIGPRVCMGASFSMMEILTVVSVLFQRFDFKAVSSADFKLTSSVSLRPSKDIMLEVRNRKV